MVLLYFIITLLLVGSRLRFYPEMKHILYDKLTKIVNQQTQKGSHFFKRPLYYNYGALLSSCYIEGPSLFKTV